MDLNKELFAYVHKKNPTSILMYYEGVFAARTLKELKKLDFWLEIMKIKKEDVEMIIVKVEKVK